MCDVGTSIDCFVEGSDIQMNNSVDVFSEIEVILGVGGEDIPDVLRRDINKVGDYSGFLRWHE